MEKRIKSFLWRAGGLATVVASAYVLNLGDLWKIDAKTLVNLTVMAVLGLIVGEITKYLNSEVKE